MLYVTTRDKSDAHTAHKTLQTDRSMDGGLYVPYRLPRLTDDMLRELRDKSFGQRMADILNLFFSAKLTAWDIDTSIGKNPARLVSMSHRILIAETWHNFDRDFAGTVCSLAAKLCGTEGTDNFCSNWAWIAIRIAMLFGVFGELMRDNLVTKTQTLDIAVKSGDFTAPMSVWYAREMGLPVGRIICCCDNNSTVWDLLNHAQLSTDATDIPQDLERLIFSTLGWDETVRYLEISARGGAYKLSEQQLAVLSSGLFAAVVSDKRMESVIPNVYNTNSYLLEPDSAVAYGGLQDYRASTGESGPALILMESSPSHSLDKVSETMGLTASELQDQLGSI